jgi:DNA-binding transcriptional MerR regulator
MLLDLAPGARPTLAGMPSKLLRAGEFGAAARLSAKALRLYAEQGLLPPAEVDPATGYRYYDPAQLPKARLIGRLRGLGLPLARIAFLAELSPAARALELRGWLRTQRDRLDERAAAVEAVGASPEASLVAAVRLREVPARKVVSRAGRIDSTRLPEHIRTAERDIRAHLGGSTEPLLVFFEDLVTPDSEGVVEVAVPYTGTVEPVGDLHVRLVPGHTAAWLAVPPAYEDMPLILRVYDAVEAWIDDHPGLRMCGHSYEVTPGTGAQFDVAFPVMEVK